MLLNQKPYTVCVFLEPWKIFLKDVSQLALLYQLYEEPKRQDFIAVDQELAHYKVHSLDVIDLCVVASECSEYLPEFQEACVANFEELVLGKGPPQIPFDLRRRLCLGLEVFQGLKMLFALTVFIKNSLLDQV